MSMELRCDQCREMVFPQQDFVYCDDCYRKNVKEVTAQDMEQVISKLEALLIIERDRVTLLEGVLENVRLCVMEDSDDEETESDNAEAPPTVSE